MHKSVLCYILAISLFLVFHSKSKAQTVEINQDSTEVIRLNNLYKLNRSQNPVKAYTYAQNALQLSQKIGYLKGEATALNNLGVFYKQRGDYDQALSYYQKALSLYDSIQNLEGYAKALNNIGTIYSLNDDFNKALNYYDRSLKIFRNLNDTARLIGGLNNIGNVYLDRGFDIKALDYYRDAIKIYEQNPNKEALFDPFSNMGNIYFMRNQYDSAFYYYTKSYRKEMQVDNKFGVASALVNLAKVQNARGNYYQALETANNAADLANSVNSKPILKDAYNILKEIHLLLGQIETSYAYLVKYHQVKDSLYSENSRQAIAEIETAMEIEQKEKEIALLRKESEIKDLQVQNSRLYNIGALISSFLLLALAILAFSRFRSSRKAKFLLEEQNKKILQSKKEIEIQKAKLESRNQTITDSIEYAKSIQDGIMNRNSFQENIPNSFVFFKPKDIVSGDFYWYTRIEDKDIIALIDCTGHGVAGAFMTVIGNSLMNQIVVEHNITDPSAILKQLDKKVMEILRQKEVRTANHSMDIALCKIDHTEKTLTFAGAKRPLYIVRNGGFEEIKGDKYTVGEYNDTPYKEFENNVIPLTAETTFYLCSDGYADQFGEKVQKKYMIKRFKRLLQTVSSKSLDNQHKSLELEMDRWKGIMEQTDDMLVIGFQVCGD